jgi:phenylalanyl-tRNA synthetase beta chain
VLEKWDLRVQRVIVAELSISGLASGDLDRVRVEPMPRFPEVDRDLAIIVDEARPAAEVAESIGRHGGSLLRRVALFDLYRGAPLAASEKSLAYRLVFGADDRTLTESEIDGAMAQVRAGVEADIGARIRS